MAFQYKVNAGTCRLLAALFAVLPAVAAYAAEPVVPGAGSILQQAQPVKQAAPSSNATGLSVEREGGAQLPPSEPFPVSSIQIAGNTIFDTPTLHALVASAEGASLSLPELDKVVARITTYYRSHGYLLARAVVPAQTIRAGVVHVTVIEARYGRIELDNRSGVNDSLLQQTLAPLQSGRAVTQQELNRALLLAGNIPGATVNATLKPGEAAGTSDLQVEAAATQPVTGSLAIDNNGNRYTGRTRLGGTINFIDPLHVGDVLSLSVLSTGNDMNYGSASYEALLDGQGTRLGGSITDLHYTLGDTLAALGGHGTAQVESLWTKHPFIRSPTLNLTGQLQIDHQKLDDQLDASDIHTNRHLDNLTASLSGDWRDAALAGAVNTWGLGVTAGRLEFDNTAAQLTDAYAAKTQGGFSKWNVNATGLQSVSRNDSLYLSVSGQWANGNLDEAEKMVAGGPYTVRAYDIGAVSGDTGALGTFEWRHELGQFRGGHWQTTVFVDSEHVTVNKDPWTGGANSATLSGAGVGLNWMAAGSSQWHARLYVAAPFGATPELVGGNKSARAWAEIGKGF